MMMKSLLKYFVELTGNPVSSSILKTIAQSPISRPIIKPFAKIYRINLEETEHPIHQYRSLNDFFTRRLKDDARPIADSPCTLASPVDGVLSEMGKIGGGRSFYIKGHHYKLDEMLGDPDKAANYQDGYFYIFYLSPSHYHRIHYPVDGKLLSRYALGGKSYPVNQFGMRFGDRPFATNYRIISELDTDFGKMAMIKIGALNINSIALYHAADHFKKGEELGFFSFGSTVIILLEKNSAFQNISNIDMEVTMGQTIGKWE